MITEDPEANSRPSESPNPLPKDNQIDDILEHYKFQCYELRASKRLVGKPFAREMTKFKAEAASALATAIRQSLPAKQSESTYKPFNADDKLLQPEYANERIWGYNHALEVVVEALRGIGLNL